MIYRRITAVEIDAVTAFCIEGLKPDRYPMVFSPAKTRAAVEHFARSQSDFQLAAFDGDRVVGAVAASVSEAQFFERCDAHVWVLYATVPGVGRTLLTRMLQWAASNPMIRHVLWMQNDDADPRTQRLAQRCAARVGLRAQQTSMQHFFKG